MGIENRLYVPHSLIATAPYTAFVMPFISIQNENIVAGLRLNEELYFGTLCTLWLEIFQNFSLVQPHFLENED